MELEIIECIAGDSFSRDFSSPQVSTLDANWYGNWAIMDPNNPEDILPSGAMELSSDNTLLELRITPSETASLEVKEYQIFAEIGNDSIAFKKQVLRGRFRIIDRGF